jgi:HAE1 family hydrophobic/amphiphilic exporter-1
MENNISAHIGLVMLIGLSAKKCDPDRGARSGGRLARPAARRCRARPARLRFRPILMTSFAFVMGVLPLALATGASSVARRILGTTVIRGMPAATVIVIFLIPVSFYVVERVSGWRHSPPAPRDLARAPLVTTGTSSVKLN